MNHNEEFHLHFNHAHEGKVPRIVKWTVIGITVATIFALIFGLVVKALWNWLMPVIFGLGVISYWQAFGIIILAKILFSGMGGHHGPDKHGPPFVGQRRFYDRWWREEGKSAFDSWLKNQGAAKVPESDVQK
jgi:hypothetical protein